MKNLLSFMLCFSLLLFVSNSVSAIDQDHSPPGIEMQYDIPDVVLAETFTAEKYEFNAIEQVSNPVMIYKFEIKRGGLYALRIWYQDSKLIINNTSFSDNSFYALNHLLYEPSISKNCNQWIKPVCKHGIVGIETGYEQVSNLSI